MAKVPPVKLLAAFRALAKELNFTEHWKGGMLIFIRKEKFQLIISTPILGKNESSMQISSATKIISFHIQHPKKKELTYKMKSTAVREGWQSFVEEKISAMLEIINPIQKCSCDAYPFPRFKKTGSVKGHSEIELVCPACNAVITYPGERQKILFAIRQSEGF